MLCMHCLGQANLYCETSEIDEKYVKWKCSICEGFNVAKRESIEPSLANPAVTFTQDYSHDVPLSSSRPLLILLVDANIKEEARKIPNILPEMKDFDIALIVFDDKAAIYHLGVSGIALADIIDEAIPQAHNYIANSSTDTLKHCISAVFGLEEKTENLSRVERLKLRKQQRQSSKLKHEKRDTANALNTALDLAAQQKNPDTRIWLFTNGFPNCGEAFVNEDQIPIEYYRLVGEAAAESNILLDVICCGHKSLHLPIYTALVDPGHGFVLTYENLDSLDLSSLWENKPVSLDLLPGFEGYNGGIIDVRTSAFLEPTHMVGPADVNENEDILPNELDVFEKACARASNRKIATRNLPDMMHILTRASVGRSDPLLTLAVLLQVNDFFQKQRYAVVQCLVRYRNGTKLITSVVTQRLSMASDVSSFIDSIDEFVMPVLLGKEAVTRSLYSRGDGDDEMSIRSDALEERSKAAQNDLDITVQKISSSFRLVGLEHGTRALDLTEEGGVRAAGSSMDFAFPPELRGALRMLYMMRRSTLLSPDPLQSADDRIALRHLFLRLPSKDCLQMMSPSLWTSGLLDKRSVGDFEAAPPETMALWSQVRMGHFRSLVPHVHYSHKCLKPQSVIASDCFWQLFIWSGSETKGPKFDRLRSEMRAFLLDRTKNRFPAPEIYSVSEGDSMSRRFTSILSPSHNDPVEHQITGFPSLSLLSSSELDQLRAKFQFHRTSSDISFRDWFWNVVSAVNALGKQGTSLCE